MEIESVAVIGAGYMGRQISLQTAVHGLKVALVDPAAGALEGARGFHAEELGRRGLDAEKARAPSRASALGSTKATLRPWAAVCRLI